MPRKCPQVQMNVVVFGVQQKRSMITLSNERPPRPYHEVRLPISSRTSVKSSEVSSSNLGRGSVREVSSADLARDTPARGGTNHVEGVREPQWRSCSTPCAGNDWNGRVEVRACTMSNQCMVQRAVFSRFQWFETARQEISSCVESQVGPMDWLMLSFILVLPAQPCFI